MSIEINKCFDWFFTFLKSLVTLLNDKLSITLSGYRISFWSILLAFFVLHILIAAFIKSGGARND